MAQVACRNRRGHRRSSDLPPGDECDVQRTVRTLHRALDVHSGALDPGSHDGSKCDRSTGCMGEGDQILVGTPVRHDGTAPDGGRYLHGQRRHRVLGPGWDSARHRLRRDARRQCTRAKPFGNRTRCRPTGRDAGSCGCQPERRRIRAVDRARLVGAGKHGGTTRAGTDLLQCTASCRLDCGADDAGTAEDHKTLAPVGVRRQAG